MSQIEDLEAIDAYFKRANTSKPGVSSIVSQWNQWYSQLGTISKYANTGTLDEARRRRAALNAALGTPENPLTSEASVTAAEKEEYLSKPTVNVTGMSAAAANKAAWTAKDSGLNGTAASITAAKKRATLRIGSTGTDVKDWQGVIKVTVDGKFGPGTQAATKVWQKAHGLKADGVVGPLTWEAAEGSAKLPGTSILDPILSILTPKTISAPAISTSTTGASTPTPKPTGAVNTVPKAAEQQAVIITTPAKTSTASMLPNIGNLPTWGKITLGILSAAGLAYGFKYTAERRKY